MKSKLLTLLAISALTVAARAESSITLTGVHNCCKKCDNGIIDAVTKAGGTAKTDKSTVTITAKDEAGAKKAAAALADAGYFGKGSEAATGLSEAKAKSVTVTGAHLCCGKCADAFNKAAMSAPGVTKSAAAKGDTSVTVEGDVSPKDLIAALNKGGFNAKVK
jgi:copper chaperone CopZ